MDDMLIVKLDMKIRLLKKALSRSFSMKDMGPAKQILGMHIVYGCHKKRDKGAPEIRHGKRETGRLDTTNKLQTKQKPEYEI